MIMFKKFIRRQTLNLAINIVNKKDTFSRGGGVIKRTETLVNAFNKAESKATSNARLQSLRNRRTFVGLATYPKAYKLYIDAVKLDSQIKKGLKITGGIAGAATVAGGATAIVSNQKRTAKAKTVKGKLAAGYKYVYGKLKRVKK